MYVTCPEKCAEDYYVLNVFPLDMQVNMDAHLSSAKIACLGRVDTKCFAPASFIIIVNVLHWNLA